MAEQLSLAQAFQNRPGRFRLLKKGIERTGWKSSSVRLLEAGCSVGDAAAMLSVEMGFDVTAFDNEPALVSEAIRIHGTGSRLHFDAADASALPYPEASFEGLYSEAAFSPMIDKSGALAEYRRVLKPGSLVLINDFVIRKDAEDAVREEVVHIPCFAGVQTRACYEELFRQAGFAAEGYYEEYGELLGVTAWLCRVYGVKPNEIGGYLSRYFHIGSPGAACGAARPDGEKGAFFKRTDLSYCQMIFQRC